MFSKIGPLGATVNLPIRSTACRMRLQVHESEQRLLDTGTPFSDYFQTLAGASPAGDLGAGASCRRSYRSQGGRDCRCLALSSGDYCCVS